MVDIDTLLLYTFIRPLQVLSMSRLGGAGAVAPLVTDIPISSVEVITNGLDTNTHTHTHQLLCTHNILFLSSYVLHRKKGVKVEVTSLHGRSGQMMVRNDR